MRAVLEEYEFCTQIPPVFVVGRKLNRMETSSVKELALGNSPDCQKQISTNPERQAILHNGYNIRGAKLDATLRPTPYA